MFKRFFATEVPKVADVVIIGGGPAGLTMGSAIKSSPTLKHLKCTLIEGGSLFDKLDDYTTNPPEHFLNRCVSLTPMTINYLKKIGAWQHVKQERIESYDGIHAYDGVSNSAIDFDSPQMATMIENFNIQAMLHERIKELNDANASDPLELKDNTKVTSITRDAKNGWPIVELSTGELIKTRLLVGCDGGRSPVRQFAGITSRGWAYDRWGIVGTLKYKDTGFRSPTGWQRFLPTGPLAQLPFPNGWCSIVWSVTPELAETLLALPDETFVSMVNAAARLSQDELKFLFKMCKEEPDKVIENVNWRLGMFDSKLSAEQEEQYPLEFASIVPGSRARFPLKLSHADDYVDERVALVGDAAHTTHPLAGQGLNMGQGDVQSLVSTLETSVNRGLDLGTKFALEPYFAERYPVNHVMLGIVDKIHKIYSTDWKPLVLARSLGLDAINNLPFIKDFMVGQISHRD